MSKGYKVLYFLLAPLIRLLFGVKVIAPENEPEAGRPLIIAANHISAADPVIVCASLKRHQPRYMAKKSLFKIPLLKQLITAFGAFPIDRTGSALGAIKTSISLLETGNCLGIFPQGHRYPGVDPRGTELKKGVGMIEEHVKVDVLPVCIKTKNYRCPFLRRTYIIIGEPIPYSDFKLTDDMNSSATYSAISEQVFDRICTLGEKFDPKSN